MILGVQSRCFAERQDAAAFYLGDREARMRAADIDRDDLFAHDSPLPIRTRPVRPTNVAWFEAMQQGIAMRGALHSSDNRSSCDSFSIKKVSRCPISRPPQPTTGMATAATAGPPISRDWT